MALIVQHQGSDKRSRRRKKKHKRVVLTEEYFLFALEKIIERDFFPNSIKLREDLAELTRTCDKQSSSSSSSSSSKLTSTSTSTLTAAQQSEINKEINVDGLNLNNFFTLYTSEDNASFNNVLESDIKDHKRRYHWAFPSTSTIMENEIVDDDVGDIIKKQQSDSAVMEQHQHQQDEGIVVLRKKLTEAGRRELDSLIKNKDEACERYGLLMLKQQVVVRNSLFFPPDESQQRSSSNGSSRSSRSKSPKCNVSRHLKGIVHSNTRLPVESMPMPTITPLLNSSSINAASNVSTVNQTYVSSPNFDFSVSAGSESHSHQFYVNPMPQREVVGHLLLDQSRNKKKKRRKTKN
jgi:hypothetical protein